MGEVWRASDARLNRTVALKVLPADMAGDPTRRQRFEQEARALASLNHPNIVAVYDVGQSNGQAYMVSELVEGESLRVTLDGRMNIARLDGVDVLMGKRFGIGALPQARDDRHSVIDTARLAAQLSVLAQAACQRDDPGMLGMLQQAVRELLPDQADIAAWLDVLTVAAPVAAVAPRLAGDLRDALTSHWPPAAAPSWWDDNPVRRYKFDIEALVKQAIAIGQQAGHIDVNRAVSWMLECAWLSQPVLGTASVDFAGKAIRSLLGTRLRTSAG